jgi:ABC transporter substrate binding protein
MSIRDRHLAVRRARPPPLRGAQVLARRLSYRSRRSAAAYSTQGAVAAKRATTTIPIVMAASTDAVRTGLVASLARPGGNITGWTFLGPELYVKAEAVVQVRLARSMTKTRVVRWHLSEQRGVTR